MDQSILYGRSLDSSNDNYCRRYKRYKLSWKTITSTRGLKFRKFSRSASAQTELVGRIANPDLMRHYAFIDINSSDLSYHNVVKSSEHMPSEYISVIIKYCDTCGKHFRQTWYCKSIVGSHDLNDISRLPDLSCL